jgi:hypothetical protein
MCNEQHKLNFLYKADDNNSTSFFVKELVAILTPDFFHVPSSIIQIAKAKGVNRSAILEGITFFLLLL